MTEETNKTDTSESESRIRIRWEVPLPWLVGGLIVICVQAAIVYFGQIRQGEIQQEQNVSIKELVKQVRELNTLIISNNVKDVEHDFKLIDHERRLASLESRAANIDRERK